MRLTLTLEGLTYIVKICRNSQDLGFSEMMNWRRPATAKRWLLSLLLLSVTGLVCVSSSRAWAQESKKEALAGAAEAATQQEALGRESATAVEADLGMDSIFSRAWRGGFVVFTVLLTLIFMSIITWAIAIAKWINLRKVDELGQQFIKSFWDSRSLNDLNNRLGDFPYSPMREIFRSGYAELVRANQLREQTSSHSVAVNAAVENLTRSLNKAKGAERHRMERYLTVLAISASAAPFIGLFGTVWGIMGAFEGIARSGSTSLAAVAPGISEALIATAFGLAAAIPAAIGYNIAAAQLRGLSGAMDGFMADFLNIVERYLVSDRGKVTGASVQHSTEKS